MIKEKDIKELTVDELVRYFRILKDMSEKYEKDLKPYFDAKHPNDKRKWSEINNELQKVNAYNKVVFNVLKEKVIGELEGYSVNNVR